MAPWSGTNLVELTRAFWAYYAVSTSADRGDRQAAEAHEWASDEVAAAVDGRADGLVPLLVALAEHAEDDAARAYLGAGPIEDLLRHQDRPLEDDLLDQLDAAARQQTTFRIAIRCVWWSDDDDPAISSRFRRFGPPL